MAGNKLKELYDNKLKSQIQKEAGLENVMEVPKVEKVVINMGLGEAIANKDIITKAVEDMTLIAGQKPVVTKARKSIAGFKIRDGWPIGCKVTLRKNNMYEFLERLIKVALPRVRDFRGLSPKSFDGRGNYTLGVTEQLIFPEIQYDKIDKIRGMDITIVTSAKSDDTARVLLKAIGLPIRDRG